MTWKTFHHRGEILRTVTAVADTRRDGLLPMDVEGVAETFGDELSLLAALQLRWHTRLAGRIERELMSQPMDLEQAVIKAWHQSYHESPGVRAVLDHYLESPVDDEMAAALAKATGKEHLLLAVMAGQSGLDDGPARDRARQVGARIEARARASYRPATVPHPARTSMLGRIKARVAA